MARVLKKKEAGLSVAEPGLRERKKARLREHIETVALSLYRERGYEGTTVEEICKRVEISQPTFYNYFPSKEAILAEHAMRGFGEPLKALLSDPASIQTKLRRYFKRVAETMLRDAKLWHAIAISGAYNPVRNPALLRSAEVGTRVLTAVLAQAQEKGELTKELSAERLASMLEGIMLRTGIEWGAGVESRSLDAAMQEALKFFLRGAKK